MTLYYLCIRNIGAVFFRALFSTLTIKLSKKHKFCCIMIPKTKIRAIFPLIWLIRFLGYFFENLASFLTKTYLSPFFDVFMSNSYVLVVTYYVKINFLDLKVMQEIREQTKTWNIYGNQRNVEKSWKLAKKDNSSKNCARKTSLCVKLL